MFIAGGEDDRASVVANKALSDTSRADRTLRERHGGAAGLRDRDGLRVDDLNSEIVASGARL